MHKAIVIANPLGGRSRRKFDFGEVVMRLQQRGMTASLVETTNKWCLTRAWPLLQAHLSLEEARV